MKPKFLLLAISALFASLDASQNINGQSVPRQNKPDPFGTVDGSKNPELIPDQLAYRMLFLSLIEPENPTDLQRARQRAKLGSLHLSLEDSQKVLAVVNEFRDRTMILDAQVAEIHHTAPIPSRGSPEWLKLADLQTQKDNLVSILAIKLQTLLSPGGTKSFRDSLLMLKTHIKRVPAQFASYQ